MKKFTLSDKELVKWTSILGADYIIRLFSELKIDLTTEQLKKVILIKNAK